MGHSRVLRGYFPGCYTPSVSAQYENKVTTTATRLNNACDPNQARETYQAEPFLPRRNDREV